MCVIGDSAGGNLAALVAQMSFVLLKLQVLVYPVCDCRYLYGPQDAGYKNYVLGKGNSYDVFGGGDYGLTYEDMQWFFRLYVQGSEGRLQEATVAAMLSPILAAKDVLAASPPTLVITAECDVLRDEGEAYADRLQSLGVAVNLVRYKGQIHGFFNQLLGMADAREAVSQVSYAIRRALHKDKTGVES